MSSVMISYSPIFRDGALIGWRVYRAGGLYGSRGWIGYEWTNDAPIDK